VSLEDIVNVQITSSTKTPTRAGFGTPLIVAYHSLYVDLVRSYTKLSEMEEDGFSSSDPAYRIARTIFSQQPRVKRVKVGRRELPFSQIVDLTPAAPALGKVYSLSVNGHEVTYTALGSDNLAAVCTALASALNAKSDADADAIVTAHDTSASLLTLDDETELNGVVGGSEMDPPRAVQATFSAHGDFDATTITVSGRDKAGNNVTDTIAVPNGGNATVEGALGTLFARITSVSVPAQSGTGGSFTIGLRARFSAAGGSGTKVVVSTTSEGVMTTFADLSASIALKDQTSDPGIAGDLSDILAADADWYGLLLDSNSKAEVLEAAAWAETQRVIFCAQTSDSEAKDSSVTTDVLSTLKADSYARTSCWFHPNLGSDFLAAGIMGNRYPDDPGSDTWAYKTIPGVSVYALTDTQKTNLHNKRGGTYTVVAGVPVTEQGKVAAGEWIDVVRFVDWLRARMQERLFFILVNAKKIPYTDSGVELVKAEVEAQLGDGVRVGGLAATPAPTVTAPLVAEVDPIDRANRVLPDIQFSGTLAGAIHAIEITGTISV